ncbi:hypothetical protein NMY22_g4071 [Coprinellus aureogranulatus]|nr:hypothetical protein NMY22_g4071 [Coprinellus aureogranulatus]
MRSPLNLLVAAAVLLVSHADASPTQVLGRELMPRSSPQPCPQRYVCPEPRPFPNFPESGDNPGPDRFKCRIGTSISDPNFAFCIYEKVTSSSSSVSTRTSLLIGMSFQQNTGNLVGATPSGVRALCWERGIPNPQCDNPSRRRAVPIRPRLPEPQQAASPVIMGKFSKAKRN